MTSKRTPDNEPEERTQSKIFRMTPEACRAFDILRAEEGPHSGPRLAAEMIDLLLIEHGKPPVGPRRPAGGAKRTASKPKPGS
ncbi:MAG TPA: hypothetical protein VN822_06135 [Candidatus Acidoferrales bacterium]|nr:hypothetical protein [Candidatus Acidoferrales bacterium]